MKEGWCPSLPVLLSVRGGMCMSSVCRSGQGQGSVRSLLFIRYIYE